MFRKTGRKSRSHSKSRDYHHNETNKKHTSREEADEKYASVLCYILTVGQSLDIL